MKLSEEDGTIITKKANLVGQINVSGDQSNSSKKSPEATTQMSKKLIHKDGCTTAESPCTYKCLECDQSGLMNSTVPAELRPAVAERLNNLNKKSAADGSGHIEGEADVGYGPPANKTRRAH